MDFDLLKQDQELILDCIYHAEPNEIEPLEKGLLFRLSKEPSIAGEFGQAGEHLLRLVQGLDFNDVHPDVFTIAEGCLASEEGFGLVACDMISAYSYIKKANLGHAVESTLRKGLADLKYTWSQLQLPIFTKRLSEFHYLRFEQQRCKREAIRAKKGIVVVETTDDAIETLDHFYYGENPYVSEIESLAESLPRIIEMKLGVMADQIKHLLNEFDQAWAKEAYFGFNPITYTKAANFIAKLNDTKEPIAAYPICLLQHTKEQAKLLDHLEAFPAAGGYALFDHYRVVLPQHVDQVQLKNQEAVGLLMGERDGVGYFISYWMM